MMWNTIKSHLKKYRWLVIFSLNLFLSKIVNILLYSIKITQIVYLLDIFVLNLSFASHKQTLALIILLPIYQYLYNILVNYDLVYNYCVLAPFV